MSWYNPKVLELLLIIIGLLAAACAYFLKDILGDVKKIKNELKPIAPAIVEIQGKFTEQGHTILFPMTVTPGSPIELTDFGRQLLKDSGFGKIISKNKKYFVDKVKEKDPKTNYDIQQCAALVISELLNNNDEKVLPIKAFAYENGMPIEILIPPAGIVLRDAVMETLKFKQ